MKTHHALPIEMRGCFGEIEENNKRSQFVELQYFYFDLKKYNYLKQIDCLENSIMWKFIKLLSGNLPEEDQYLYKIITYKADNDIEDIFLFNESISDYKEFAFRSIEEALEFCFKKFGITMINFKPQEETHIP